jgi:hypothetical protein
MTAQLRINYSDLNWTNNTLLGMTNEFSNIQAQESEYDWAYGSANIAGAMGNFAGNWTYHRKQLMGSMSSLQSMVAEALQAFPKTDQQLTSQLTKKQK